MRLGVEAALIRGKLVPGDVEIDNGVVAAYGLAPAGRGGRGIAVPGFVDLQVNGFGGVDLIEADAEGFRRAGEALLETGVTAYLPTFITAPEEQVLSALASVPVEGAGARILGVHLEGPFLAPNRLGAHPAEHRRDPDPALLTRLVEAGPVRLVTLAPELDGAHELIALLTARGITVSCGHSDATAEEAVVAFDAGIATVTHLFNAMRPLADPDGGLAGAALARDDIIVQIILDHIHVGRQAAELVWRTAGGRVALVTDAIAAAGTASGDGASTLGGTEIAIRNGVARRNDGALAGSLLTMIEAVRFLHALGASVEQALEAASAVPARVLREPNVGTLDAGLRADIVVLGDDLAIERVLVGGAVSLAA